MRDYGFVPNKMQLKKGADKKKFKPETKNSEKLSNWAAGNQSTRSNVQRKLLNSHRLWFYIVMCVHLACQCQCLRNFTILAMDFWQGSAHGWLRCDCIPSIEPYRVHCPHTHITHAHSAARPASYLFIIFLQCGRWVSLCVFLFHC